MKKRTKYKLNNTGSTMVETLVSFVVLFIVLASLYGIVSFSNELYMKSVDTSRINQKFYIEIYKYPLGKVTGAADDAYVKPVNYDPGYAPADEDDEENGEEGDGENTKYAGLTLLLDTEKTKPENGIENAIRDAYISLDNVGVTSFTCNDEEAEEEELILPKAIHFWWIAPEP